MNEEPRKRPRVFAVLPTLLTLANGVCGFGSITFAAKVGLAQQVGWVRDNPYDYLFVAGALVFLAMVFDMLDGRAARWAKQSSQFGAELDSLCDAISFGVAPAFILIKFSPTFHPRLLWVIAVLFVVCVVLRLARFNVETDEDEESHDYFSGLPSPAAAGTVASFMIAYPELATLADPQLPHEGFFDHSLHRMAAYLLPALQFALPLITLAAACLMVSRVRYSHVFNQWFRGRKNFRHLLLLVVGIAVAFIVQELAVPLIFCWFAFSSPLRAAWMKIVPQSPRSAVESEARTLTENHRDN